MCMHANIQHTHIHTHTHAHIRAFIHMHNASYTCTKITSCLIDHDKTRPTVHLHCASQKPQHLYKVVQDATRDVMIHVHATVRLSEVMFNPTVMTALWLLQTTHCLDTSLQSQRSHPISLLQCIWNTTDNTQPLCNVQLSQKFLVILFLFTNPICSFTFIPH